MGTSLGAALSKAGVPVELVSRNAAHVEALRTRGAVLSGSVSMTVPVTAMLPEEMAGKYDIIFADPPYALEGLDTIPSRAKGLLSDIGTLILEHPGTYDFSECQGFTKERKYGSVHFSFFANN